MTWSERELAAIYENTPGILFSVAVEADDEFRFLSMSRTGLEAMGLSRDQVVGVLVRDVIPEPSRDGVLTRYREAIRTGHTVRWTETTVYPAGQRVGEVAVTPIRDADGAVTHLIGIVHDITEREELEEALRRREQRERLALDASAAGSWTWDSATNQIDWDDRFRALYGLKSDAPPSADGWLACVHEEDRPHLLAEFDQVLHGKRKSWNNTFRVVKLNGTTVWIQSQGRADCAPDGRLARLTGLELDVTERRHAEQALQARREQEHDRELRLLLETSTQGVVSVDTRGAIVTANHALETMFGWRPGELIGEPLERLLPEYLRELHEGHRSAYIAAPHPRLMGGGLELVGQRKDGSTFPIEVSLNHVGQPGSGRVFAFVTDTTERRRAEDALAERTAELERQTLRLRQMASDLTLAERRAREEIAKTLHDGLQQMLVIASLNVERQVKRDADHGVSPSDLLAEASSNLAQAIAAARSLSIDLYPPVLRHAGLPMALQWLANWTRDKYGIDVTVTADPNADSPRKDVRALVFESVRELLFNAVKHARTDHVDLRLACEGEEQLSITVADRGVGFDPATLAEPSNGEHVGWGLFSIRERFALLGGRFTIDSAPGTGTRFQLFAPRGSAHSVEGDPASDLVIASSQRAVAIDTESAALRILLVDDHSAVRKIFRDTMHHWPEFCVVGEASNGFEAIAQVRALQPHVVLMDVSMPHMDGINATRQLRAEFPSVRVLGLSMQQPPAGGRHAIEQAGAAGFFVKGVDTQRLIDYLRELNAARRRRAQRI